MRREYSKEFKQDAVSLVVDQGYKCTEAAAILGLHKAMLSRWVKKHKEDSGSAFRRKGPLRPEQQELRQPREANKRLKMEKEF